jgi:5'-nucleotidase
MKVLISNDDGIFANGLQTLAERLSRQYEVYVVAPDRERSAMGHALTLHQPLRIDEVSLDFPVVKAYAVSGTPSDCVKIALNALLDLRPDVVVSGINHGPNLGGDVLYSGTVSAALEGAIYGVPSVAVSLLNGYEKSADFSHAAEFIATYLPRVVEAGLPDQSILNVNFPAVSLNFVSGVKLTTLGTRMYTDTYEKRLDPRGQVYYWLAGELVKTGQPPDSDIQAIRDNMISVTPVKIDLTNYELIDTCRGLLDFPLP